MFQLYKVSGKSMETDRIYQDDFVIVNPEVSITNHDIVVLSLSNQTFLIKHFYKKGRHLFFYPFGVSPPTKKSYRPLDEAKIIGKVVGIIANHKKKRKKD